MKYTGPCQASQSVSSIIFPDCDLSGCTLFGIAPSRAPPEGRAAVGTKGKPPRRVAGRETFGGLVQIPDEFEESHLWDQRMEVIDFVQILQRNSYEDGDCILQQDLIDHSTHGIFP